MSASSAPTFVTMSKETKKKENKLDGVASIKEQPKEPYSKRWMLYIKKEYRKLGDPKTYRLFFRTYRDANDWRTNRKADFETFKDLSDREISDARLAFHRVKSAGFETLEDGIGFPTLESAIDYLIKENKERKAQSDVTINMLIDKKIEKHKKKKGGRGGSEETIKEVIHRGKNMFGKEFGEMRVCDFRNKHFKPWWEAHERSPHLLRTSKAIFGFCIKEYRGEESIITENPITEVLEDRPKEQPHIFKDNEWKRLILAAIETNDSQCTKGSKFELLAYVTLGLWCGIRPGAELQKLNWDDVFLEDEDPDVYIPQFRKTKYSRRINIPHCAIPLLKKCQKKDGPICNPSNFRKRWDTLRDIAQVSKSHGVWRPDIMRHTFASMHYAMYQSKEKVRVQLGHVVDETLDYYINFGKKRKKQAEEFWNFKLTTNS